MSGRGKSTVRAFWVAAYLLLGTSMAIAADAKSQLKPDELVKQVVEEVLKDLEANRAEYRKDPQKIRVVVDKYMLPHFDTRYAAQAVLGQHWRAATEEQRKRFVEAFYQSLLQNYGEAIIDFTADRLKIFPYTGKLDETTKAVSVRSEVRRDNGSRVPVNYSLRRSSPQDDWKAYDVQIEGVSYIRSFKTDFASEIEQKGLEAVIQRLESQVASGTIAKPTGKPTA